jgi:predicted nucleic acid-binding Zn finger protein
MIFVKFKPDVLEWCSCKDNSTRHLKCKHILAIEFAIKWGTIKNIDKVLSTTTATTANVKQKTSIVTAINIQPKSYKDDDYYF